MNYYNEWDKGAAAWLRELIKAGRLPRGYVDERSITEVTPADLAGFTQCHFFAGIGGWSYALALAGVSQRQKLWTGSPPCQPFSVAGKQLGQLDERHLAPTFMRLVDQCRPPILFGEQVAAAIGKHWLDDLFLELERQGYACGAAVLPACSVGAPHKRDRLFFGAALWMGDSASTRQRADEVRQHSGNGQQLEGAKSGEHDKHRCSDGELADTNGEQRDGGGNVWQGGRDEPADDRISSSVADTNDTRPQGRVRMSERADKQPAGEGGVAGNMAYAYGEQQRPGSVGEKSAGDVSGGRQQGAATSPGLCSNIGMADPEYFGHSKPATSATEQGGNKPHIGVSNGGHLAFEEPETTNQVHGYWSDADWLGCRDGKFRPVESGTFPLANGVPARVGRLRGYGNAIVPQVAAEFIKAFYGAITDAGN